MRLGPATIETGLLRVAIGADGLLASVEDKATVDEDKFGGAGHISPFA